MTFTLQRRQTRNTVSFIAGAVLMLVGLTPVVLAESDELMQAAVALANAEANVAESNVAVIRQRADALQSLSRSSNASWLELASAEIELNFASNEAVAYRNVATWLTLQMEELPTAGENLVLPHEPSLMVNLYLPGSRAVLGWVDVAHIPGPLQLEVLSMMAARASRHENGSALLTAQEYRVRVIEEAIKILQSADQRNQAEIDRLNLRRSAASANLELIREKLRFEDAVNRQTQTTISRIRQATPLETDVLQVLPSTYEPLLHEILMAEANASGALRLGEIVQKWSNSRREAQRTLNAMGLSSIARMIQSRHESESIQSSLEGSHAMQQWRTDWLRESLPLQSASVTSRESRQNSEKPSAAMPSSDLKISKAIHRNTQLLSLTIQLYREHSLLQAQLKSAHYQIDVQRKISSRLSAQTSMNSAELEQAQMMQELVERQVDAVTEQIEVSSLAMHSIPELAKAQSTVPANVLFVNSQASEVIMMAAREQQQRTAQPAGYIMEQQLQKQAGRIKMLFDMGYASRKEVTDIEQRVLDARGEFERELSNRDVAEIDLRIKQAILTSIASEPLASATGAVKNH